MAKYNELQKSIQDYGRAAFENMCLCRHFAETLAKGMPGYLDCDPSLVALVPAEGPFDPKRVYGDEAFSFHGAKVIALAPIQFGVSLVAKNPQDDEALWLRARVSVEVVGGMFVTFIGFQRKLEIPTDEVNFEKVYERIYKEYLDTFKKEVDEYRSDRLKTGIGFVAG
ncbi:MAG: hypothetical protein AAGC95_12770 [Pseudomonadota bacterium]